MFHSQWWRRGGTWPAALLPCPPRPQPPTPHPARLPASPLSSLWNVVRTRNAAAISANWPLSFVSLANAALWTAYGIAINRPFVYGPNGVGVLLALVQLALCVVLPSQPVAGGGAPEGAAP